MAESILAQRTWKKHPYKVQFSLAHLSGNDKPHFSILAGEWDPRERDYCLCAAHDIIREHFPELAKWIPMHLSTSDGVPMHWLENGYYYLTKKANDGVHYEFPDQVSADHFRVPLSHVMTLRGTAELMGKEALAKYIGAREEPGYRPRYLQEASELLTFIKSAE